MTVPIPTCLSLGNAARSVALFISLLACDICMAAGEPATDTRLKELEQQLEDHGIHLETSQPGIVLSGFVDAGYTYNFVGARSETLANTPSQGDFQLFHGHLNIEKGLGDANTTPPDSASI